SLRLHAKNLKFSFCIYASPTSVDTINAQLPHLFFPLKLTIANFLFFPIDNSSIHKSFKIQN
ncbi:hypothetical protein P3X46_020188, partial [Hevea brasiliensis]